jgi:polyisoprenoid-binding protein YceI
MIPVALLLGVFQEAEALACRQTFVFGAVGARSFLKAEAELEGYGFSTTGTAVHGVLAPDGDAWNLRLKVPAGSLDTGMRFEREWMLGEHCLDAKRHPTIVFEAERAGLVKEGVWRFDGALTLHGVSRPLSMTAELKELSEEVARRAGLGPGRWVRLTSRFTVKPSEYGVAEREVERGRFRDAVEVTLTLLGTNEPPP